MRSSGLPQLPVGVPTFVLLEFTATPREEASKHEVRKRTFGLLISRYPRSRTGETREPTSETFDGSWWSHTHRLRTNCGRLNNACRDANLSIRIPTPPRRY